MYVIILKQASLENLCEKNRYCSQVPSTLLGPIEVVVTPPSFLSDAFKDVGGGKNSSSDWYRHFSDRVQMGGQWSPSNCTARHRLAVIVPYRNRLENLNTFLYHMHPLFQRQQLAYRVFVVEQVTGSIFNKGILMNTGFLYAFNLSNFSTEFITKRDYRGLNNRSLPFDCFVFHDVDLLPEGYLKSFSKKT